ncbi:MAG: hypothetical protein ABFS35_07855 [Bacteroidota bacterium]
MMQSKKKDKTSLKKVIIALLWIVLLSLSGFGIMVLISPEAKALPVFLIAFFIIMVVIVLIALYINYAVSIYKEIRED